MPSASQPADHPSLARVRLSRRRFEALAVAGAASWTLSALSAAAPALKRGWIDAHVHVWTPDTQRYPLADGFGVSEMQPPSFTPKQLFSHCKPAGVSRVVLIQMSYYGFDNRYMLDMMAAYPGTFSGVAIVDVRATDVVGQIASLAGQGVRGLRVHPEPGEAAGWASDDAMATVWKTADDLGVAICLLINPADIAHVDMMCGKFPQVRVVVDHFARIGMSGPINQQHVDALCRLARYPNVYVKTSAFYALGQKQPPYTDLIPLIERLVGTFGSQRLMWASDCPFQLQGEHTYADSIALIRDRIDSLSESDRQAMLRTTAETVFFSAR